MLFYFADDNESGASAGTITEFYKWEQDGFVPPLKLPKHDDLDPSEYRVHPSVNGFIKFIKNTTA